MQERLGKHVQHLLKFGRDVFDPLQYDAVVADINKPLLINAGKAPPPCPPPGSPRAFPPNIALPCNQKDHWVNSPIMYAS